MSGPRDSTDCVWWADADGFRLIVRPDPQEAGARYTVLRRQYGEGSFFALVASGLAASTPAAKRAAEQVAGLVELTWRSAPDADVPDTE